jgi:hypothetical protein
MLRKGRVYEYVRRRLIVYQPTQGQRTVEQIEGEKERISLQGIQREWSSLFFGELPKSIAGWEKQRFAKAP